MGILEKMRSRDKPQNRTPGSSYNFLFGNSTAGKTVDARSSMQLTAVYACVRVLSEAVASLPLYLYEYSDGSGSIKATKHPLYRVLHDEPNAEMTSFAFRETLMTHILLWGNAYAQIIRNGKGEVVGLYPLMPNRMQVDRDPKTKKLVYTYTIDNAEPLKEQGQIKLDPEEVLHIPGLGFDGLVGYSPIAMAKNALGIALACEEYGAKFFANGASPSGVLEHPGILKDPERVRNSWNAAYGGSANSHKVAVLEEGMKYTPISINPSEAQFLETRKFQIDEIARMFRVPPHLIGDLEHATFSNIEHQGLEFVKYSLDPWLVRFEQNMVRKLLNPEEKTRYYIEFNAEGLLRGDLASRYQAYATARQNGWMSTNDIRAKEGLDLLTEAQGGNRYLCNGNMVDIATVGKDKQGDNK